MIKLEKWFPDGMKKEYLAKILKKVEEKNIGSSYLTYLRTDKKAYLIKIEDLLTQPLSELMQMYSGLKLYIYLCGLEQYKNMTARKIMDTLVSCDLAVIKTDDDVYELPGYGRIEFSGKTLRKRDDLIKKEDFELIRRFLIEKIQQYDKLYYYHVVTLNPDYDKSKELFAKAIDSIRAELDQSLLSKSAGTASAKGGYDSMGYIIHYSMLDNSLRHKLLRSLGVTTCPYCNRQFITGYIDENHQEKTTADLDHFYQKGIYPLFALSLFNFIPSCQICNSRMKGEKQIHSLYPYYEGFKDKVKFCLVPSKKDDDKALLRAWLGDRQASDDIRIDLKLSEELEPSYAKRAEGSIALFKLKQIYAIHKEKALDTIRKKRIYWESPYKQFMEDLFKRIGLAFSEEDILAFLVGYHWQDQNYDEPLSKFVHDIFYSDETEPDDLSE